MKKIYNLFLMSGLMISAIAVGQTDKQLSTTAITAAQRQAILANVIDGSSTRTINTSKVSLSCDSLEVDSLAGNGYHGNMFDVSVTANTTLETFSVSVDAGTVNIAIFYRVGTFVSHETSSTGWIFLDSASVVSTTTAAPGFYYKVPVNLNLPLISR